MRGLNTKLRNIYLKSFDCDFKILVFTETWLKPQIRDTEILSDQYQIYRKDRLNKMGGGVFIAVHNSIASEHIFVTEHPKIEFVCVKLKYLNCNFIITCSYIPPNSYMDTYLMHSALIKEVSLYHSSNAEMICLGISICLI